jgi:hypothetical protein
MEDAVVRNDEEEDLLRFRAYMLWTVRRIGYGWAISALISFPLAAWTEDSALVWIVCVDIICALGVAYVLVKDPPPRLFPPVWLAAVLAAAIASSAAGLVAMLDLTDALAYHSSKDDVKSVAAFWGSALTAAFGSLSLVWMARRASAVVDETYDGQHSAPRALLLAGDEDSSDSFLVGIPEP